MRKDELKLLLDHGVKVGQFSLLLRAWEELNQSEATFSRVSGEQIEDRPKSPRKGLAANSFSGDILHQFLAKFLIFISMIIYMLRTDIRLGPF